MDLKFQFASMTEFFSMSGHGPYVWAAYAITLAALLYLIIKPWYHQRSFKMQQKMIAQQTDTQETSSSHASR